MTRAQGETRSRPGANGTRLEQLDQAELDGVIGMIATASPSELRDRAARLRRGSRGTFIRRLANAFDKAAAEREAEAARELEAARGRQAATATEPKSPESTAQAAAEVDVTPEEDREAVYTLAELVKDLPAGDVQWCDYTAMPLLPSLEKVALALQLFLRNLQARLEDLRLAVQELHVPDELERDDPRVLRTFAIQTIQDLAESADKLGDGFFKFANCINHGSLVELSGEALGLVEQLAALRCWGPWHCGSDQLVETALLELASQPDAQATVRAFRDTDPRSRAARIRASVAALEACQTTEAAAVPE